MHSVLLSTNVHTQVDMEPVVKLEKLQQENQPGPSDLEVLLVLGVLEVLEDPTCRLMVADLVGMEIEDHRVMVADLVGMGIEGHRGVGKDLAEQR